MQTILIILGIIVVVLNIAIITKVLVENYWYNRRQKVYKVIIILVLPLVGAIYVFKELYDLDKTLFINKKENINSNRNRPTLEKSKDNAMLYEAITPMEDDFKEVGNYQSSIDVEDYYSRQESSNDGYTSGGYIGGSDGGGGGGD